MTTAPACFGLLIRARCPGVPCLAALHRLRQQRREVDHLQLRPGLAHTVVEHHGAEGTRHGQRLCAGRGCFADALLVDRTAAALLHPHPRAAPPPTPTPAPPAPQQNVRLPLRAISTGRPAAATSSRGSAMTSLWRGGGGGVGAGGGLVGGGGVGVC